MVAMLYLCTGQCESPAGGGGNPGDSDIPPRDNDNGVQTQAVLTFEIKRFPPLVVGNRGDSDTKDANKGGDFDRRNCQNPLGLPIGEADPGDSHWLVHYTWWLCCSSLYYKSAMYIGNSGHTNQPWQLIWVHNACSCTVYNGMTDDQ